MAKKRYLEINGKEIEVSEEVYKEYMKPIWREKKRIQRAYKNLEELQDKDRIKTATEKNGNYVQAGSLETGFVETKEYGLPLSLDVAEEKYDFEVTSVKNTEDIVTYKLLEEAFLEVISEFSERDKKVLKLLFLYEMKEREVAEVVGISQKTVNNIKNKHLPKIQEKLRPWKK
ncbi:sigma-70 family RNA polymerase sigma factor [Peptoniphilus harei]|uniref:sigma-70 family RNA polymerase sigma factor n=1 Tax=Peptoniphilus harei TaxID=54005 RepID=UPI0011DE4D52|nr:sigma-70 family RNA polymerase sigma factor [Peptoniphilus harei]